jgi:tetratricopeptide (TPR) repeat protein
MAVSLEEPLRTFFALAVLVALAGCASTSPEADDTYRKGLSLANSDTAGAIKIFEDGVASYPKHNRMRFALARLQYDTGETQHLAERDAMALARTCQDQKRVQEAQKAERDAQDRHQKALPFYRAARENLKIVAENDPDEARDAWAYELLMKCDVFFEEYDTAADHLKKAIDMGRPSGAKLSAMQQYLAELRKESGRRDKGDIIDRMVQPK